MSETIPYIIAEDGYYYVAYKEKAPVPEIVVSSKGIANGLSEEYNDGWDFGPDTYNPNSTANPPYTQTSGIQEAINSLPLQYIAELGIYAPVGTIKIMDGTYNCTDTIFIDNMSIVNIIGENAGGGIFVGGDPYTGTGAFINSTGQYGAISQTTNNPKYLFGRVKLENLYIQYTLPSGQTSIDSTTAGGGGAIIKLDYFDQNIMIGLRVGTQSLINNQSVISGGIGIDDLFYVDRVFTHAPSSMTHLASHSNHLHVGFLAMYCNPDNGPVNGFSSSANGIIQIGGGYDMFIDQIHVYESAYNILYLESTNFDNSSPARQSSLLINSLYLELSTPSQTTGYYPFSIYNNVIIVSYQESPESSTYNPLTDATNNFALPMKILSTANDLSVPPPATPSVPASGTAQQNTNPYPVKVYVNGGALTEVQITIGSTTYTVYSNSTASAVYEGFTLPAGASITLTYTTAPTWSWVPE